MILFTDIVGSHVGYAILRLVHAQEIQEEVRVMVSPQDKISLDDGCCPVIASLYDLPSLDRALNGVDKLLICTSNLLTDCRAGYLNLLHEAVDKGVKQLVFISSVGDPHSTSIPMLENRETEYHVQTCGIPYVIFRVNILMENLPFFVGNSPADVLAYPAANGRVAFVSAHDVAQAVYPFLSENFPIENRIYTLSHETAYSFADVATQLSACCRHTVRYQSIDLSFYREALCQIPLPVSVVERLCSVAKAIASNYYNVNDYTLKKLLSRSAEKTPLRQRVRQWFSQKETSPFLFGNQLTMLSDYLYTRYRPTKID